MKNIKVSVIIQVNKNARYLGECLASVCSQTLKEIEIIIINDCLDKKTSKIINEYLNKDQRIKIITNEIYKGSWDARSLGIKISNGEYLIFLSSDNICNNNFLELIYNHSKKKNADIVFTKFNIVDSNNNIVCENRGFLGIYDNNNINYANYLLIKNDVNIFMITTSTPWNKVYRRNFIVENKRFLQDIKNTNDVYFFKVTFFLAKSIYSFNASLINFRKICSNNTSNTMYMLCDDIFKENDEVLRFLLNSKANSYIIKNFIISAINNFFIESQRIPKKSFIKKIYFLIKAVNFLPVRYYFSVFKFLFKNFLLKNNVKIKNCIVFKLFYIIKFFFARFGIINSKYQVNIVKLNNDLRKIDTIYNKFRCKQQIPVIISLTSFPQRINEVKYVLFSLINQTVRPIKIILWLADDQFLDTKLVYNQFQIFYKYSVEIKFTKNIGSYKKIIPALSLFQDNILVTADDDIYYPKDWLKKLYDCYLEHKDEKVAVCHRMHKIVIKDEKIASYRQWEHVTANLQPSPLNFATSGGGILFPPHCFYKDITSEQLFMRLAKYGDDIWLWAMLVLNGWNYISASQEKFQINSINLIREKNIFNHLFTLSSINLNKNNNDEQISNILCCYPEILLMLNNAIK